MSSFPLTIAHILRHGETVHARSEVVTYRGGPTTTTRTYADIARRARALASGLASLGVARGDRVATLCWNHSDHLEAYLAVPSMGAVLLPLNLRLSAKQLRFIATNAQPRALIIDSELLGIAGTILETGTSIETVIVVGTPPADGRLAEAGIQTAGYEELLAAAQPMETFGELNEGQPAVMCYTTGTTGSPKGIVYSHRSTYLHALAICVPNVFCIGETTRALVAVPMFHATAWGIPYGSFWMGADQLMPHRFLQGEHLAAFAAAERATFTAAVPTVLADVHRAAMAAGYDLSSLELVIGGGSAVPRSLIDRWYDDLGVTVVQAWGMTETSPVAAIARAPRNPADNGWSHKTGRPVPGVELRIVDDHGAPLPRDGKTVGELQARGPWVTCRYHLDQAPDCFDDGWLRTGDVGHMDEGHYVQLTDRVKDVIKSGGEWISSLEIENVLQSHPLVAEAGVIGVTDQRWKERPLACVVLRAAADDRTFTDLAQYLGERVPRWWVPERWTELIRLPRTSVGKIDKVNLREQYAEGRLAVNWAKTANSRAPSDGPL